GVPPRRLPRRRLSRCRARLLAPAPRAATTRARRPPARAPPGRAGPRTRGPPGRAAGAPSRRAARAAPHASRVARRSDVCATPSGSGSRDFRLHQRAVKLLGRPGGEQPPPHRFAPHQARDPAQSLHVNAGMGLWAGEQEEQAHGLSVDRLVGNRGWRRAGHHHEAGQCGTAAVRHRHPITDPGRELALAFEDRPQNLVGLRRTYPSTPACPRAPAALLGQEGAGAGLWRLAATTLAQPPALATGGAAGFWNPAQPATGERAAFGLEVVNTPSAVGASGVLFTARARVSPVGRVG